MIWKLMTPKTTCWEWWLVLTGQGPCKSRNL